jgi:hypothetical protein
MPEHARDCTVILLDGTQLKVPVKSSLSVEALLDIASSHAGLKKDENRHFFGLYIRNNGWNNWLDSDKPVLASHHDIPKLPYVLFLHYGVRYYVEDYRQIPSAQALDMYYHQVKKSIVEEELVCTSDDVYNLSACVMQAQFGDFTEDSEAEGNYDKLDCIPPSLVAKQSKETCKTRILAIYKNMRGLSRAESVIRYLDIAQALGPYGHHLFKVKDKKENVFYIGIGREGVKVFSEADRIQHSEKFQWRVLQNVTYKDKKFWFDVCDGVKGSGSGHAHTYYASSTRQAMNIWQMAKDQHSFFKKRKNIGPYHSASVDEKVMDQLNQIGAPVGGGTNGIGRISPSGSMNSLSSATSGHSQLSHASYASSQTSKTTVSAEAHEAARKAQNDTYSAFMSKRAVLMTELEQNIKMYKELQAKEMRITGVRPEGLSDDELKELSQKVQGNQYRFSKLLLEDSQDEVTSLERDLELKRSIIEATKRLLSESHNKKLRKDRKKELKEQEEKYRELQHKLERRKERSGLYFRSKTSEFHLPSPAEGSYDIHAGTLPRQRKKKTSLPTSADDSCIAELLFDSRSSINGRLSPKPSSSLNILNSRQMNKSTGALNELTGVNKSATVGRRSPVPQHHSLLTSSPHAQKTKARSLLSLSDHQESGNECSSPTNSSAHSFHLNDTSDGLNSTGSSMPMSGSYQVRSQNQSQSSLRTVNLTDELLTHYTSNDVDSIGSDRMEPVRNEVSNVTGSRFSPNLSTRYSVNNNGPISRSSVVPRDNGSGTRLAPSTSLPVDDHPHDLRSRSMSYSLATRDNPISSGHSTPVPTHPHIRPANSTRVSDTEESAYVRMGYGHAQNSPRVSKSPLSSSPGSVNRSSSMMNRRVTPTPSGVGGDHHPHKPYQRGQWSGYMESHSESLELQDPLTSLRGQSNAASEGTYV